ncbi:hypothetical protein RND71_015803 [Anisodus tanguticus]|uniref:Uncharacterized protein n=1 Tax=Anisodus tanguticus TaxID=243964 RepID=A0AAE1S703_9SOLA|nr:hypothetical protein RND71_015803 [Anisodus tanguticus]
MAVSSNGISGTQTPSNITADGDSQFKVTEEGGALVTFRSSAAKTQIDFLLLKKVDKGFCKDCKVISREDLTTRHKLLVMDFEIKMEKKKRVVDDRLRIKWWSLTMTSAKEMGERLMAKGAWGCDRYVVQDDQLHSRGS